MAPLGPTGPHCVLVSKQMAVQQPSTWILGGGHVSSPLPGVHAALLLCAASSGCLCTTKRELRRFLCLHSTGLNSRLFHRNTCVRARSLSEGIRADSTGGDTWLTRFALRPAFYSSPFIFHALSLVGRPPFLCTCHFKYFVSDIRTVMPRSVPSLACWGKPI